MGILQPHTEYVNGTWLATVFSKVYIISDIKKKVFKSELTKVADVGVFGNRGKARRAATKRIKEMNDG